MAIEFSTSVMPVSTRLEATNIQTLSTGAPLKAEVGDQELNTTVPEGKQWDVVLSLRVIERDA